MPSVGKPIPHDSARGHVTGSADFMDDWPSRVDELQVGFVGSPEPCGKLLSIDAQRVKEMPGVVAVLTHEDLPGKKSFGPFLADEPCLAIDEVHYVGQPVAVIAAEDREILEQARRAVHVSVEAGTPSLSIEEAIQRQRFIGPPRRIQRGDVSAALAAAPNILEDVLQIGGQDHLYFESHAALAIPGEEGQLVVHSSTQNTTQIQSVVAEALGLAMHQVVCVCKRMGGAFGGKETQAAIPAVMAALVAHETGRPARITYAKDDDMQVTGKRHAYRSQWRVGFDEQGIIQAYEVQFYSDGGAAADLSINVMERSMLHAENAYFVPHIDIRGQVCFTNRPPNTACRGFGGPQAMVTIENVIERIAEYLGLDAFDVRMGNLYGVGQNNETPYGQIIDHNHLPEIMSTLAAASHYKRRRSQIIAANRADVLNLRGIAMTPVKFGISFTGRFLNQGNALVNVYTDGTVQVSTGGTEMGQGLNTKIRQLVADELGLPPNSVMLMPTSTEKNNNTSPTAASSGTDLNGAAAVNACREIKHRLADLAARRFADAARGLIPSPRDVVFANGEVHDRRAPDSRMAFGELAKLARLERVDLGARGFHATPGVDFNRDTGRGHPFYYYTQGAAVAEVSIDRFTGDLVVPRVDLLIDIGRSINPGVDLGQITGGFMQGMGWVTCETLVYDDRGVLLSRSPTTYKVPAITDVPTEFHCHLFESDDNVETVARSKAVGEPPLMLSISVWAAVRDALRQVAESPCDLRVPATGEEILRCLQAYCAVRSTGGPP